jgi:hypothetical protein
MQVMTLYRLCSCGVCVCRAEVEGGRCPMASLDFEWFHSPLDRRIRPTIFFGVIIGGLHSNLLVNPSEVHEAYIRVPLEPEQPQDVRAAS